ncbi:MAG: ATP-binding protein, partial [Phycisphaerae bacterium]
LLDKARELRTIDLGLITSSQAADMLTVIIKRLREEGDLERDISANFLVRNWPAMTEWSTKAVRDAFFASPQLPRLMNGDVVKDTIARGVRDGVLAYVGKKPDGHYEPFIFEKELAAADVEISEDMFVIRGEEAKKHVEPPRLAKLIITPVRVAIEPGQQVVFRVQGLDQFGRNMDVAKDAVTWTASGGTIAAGTFTAGALEGAFSVQARTGDLVAVAEITVSKAGALPLMKAAAAKQMGFRWSGEVPPQKWMNFYTKVLSRHVTDGGLKLTVNVEVNPDGGVSEQRLEEARAALRELGLSDQIDEQ